MTPLCIASSYSLFSVFSSAVFRTDRWIASHQLLVLFQRRRHCFIAHNCKDKMKRSWCLRLFLVNDNDALSQWAIHCIKSRKNERLVVVVLDMMDTNLSQTGRRLDWWLNGCMSGTSFRDWSVVSGNRLEEIILFLIFMPFLRHSFAESFLQTLSRYTFTTMLKL